jgi:hypothetical protein
VTARGYGLAVACYTDPDGHAPLLFDAGSPLLSSAVFAGPADGGAIRVGADAENAAFGYPAGFEANPKRPPRPMTGAAPNVIGWPGSSTRCA